MKSKDQTKGGGRKARQVKRTAVVKGHIMSAETYDALKYGDLPNDLKPVWSAVMFLKGLPDEPRFVPNQFIAHVIVGDWLANIARAKDGDSLRILARLIDRGEAGDPLLLAVIDFAEQKVKIGQSILNVLQTSPIGEILDHLKFRHVKASEVTVRQAINSLGIKRPSGGRRKTAMD